jgi:ring-1,2-phenylacetyl-CoA epoxidase subunit PaaC
MDAKVKFLLHLADNPLILGQRLGEWCGHGPVLEQDIALTNIALDLIGQARLIYQYIAGMEGQQTNEDALAMLRYENEYLNFLLVEQPNLNFGHTISRQFLFDTFHLLQTEQLTHHPDAGLNAIAVKSLKEIKYHYRYSSEWMLRLGDGTEESHTIMQDSIDALWRYTGEFFKMSSYESALLEEKYSLDVSLLATEWNQRVSAVLTEAGLKIPEKEVMLFGGKEGRHTEHMGYILTELQYMQRTYPQMNW